MISGHNGNAVHMVSLQLLTVSLKHEQFQDRQNLALKRGFGHGAYP